MPAAGAVWPFGGEKPRPGGMAILLMARASSLHTVGLPGYWSRLCRQQ